MTDTHDHEVIPIRRRIPNADSWRVFRCPHCPHAHIVLIDAEGWPIAQFVIGSDQFGPLTIEILDALAGKGEMLP